MIQNVPKCEICSNVGRVTFRCERCFTEICFPCANKTQCMVSCEGCNSLLCVTCDTVSVHACGTRLCRTCKTNSSCKDCGNVLCELCKPVPRCGDCGELKCFPYCIETMPTFRNVLTVFKDDHFGVKKGCFLSCEKCGELKCWDCSKENFEFCGKHSDFQDGCLKAFCKETCSKVTLITIFIM